MGRSVSLLANVRMTAITEACRKNSGSQNSWSVGGRSYFFQEGKEQRDGSITGQILRCEGEGAKPAGSFKIDADGKMVRGPAFFKAAKAFAVRVDAYNHSYFPTQKFGMPTPLALAEYVSDFAKSFEKGGVNQHVRPIHPRKAEVVELDTGLVVATWTAPLFQLIN